MRRTIADIYRAIEWAKQSKLDCFIYFFKRSFMRAQIEKVITVFVDDGYGVSYLIGHKTGLKISLPKEKGK
jgi:isocitrate dehydrogenase